MSPRLHNPVNQAHLEELKDRVLRHLEGWRPGRCAPEGADRLAEALADVVRAMDRGTLSEARAAEIFAASGLPGFFGPWMVEMRDEGVYLDEAVPLAA